MQYNAIPGSCVAARSPTLSLSVSFSLAVDRAFTAMQIIATIACSVSVALLALAFFRPSARGCSSARSLAFVGGALMAAYALFQLIAVVLGGTLKQELRSAGGLYVVESNMRGRHSCSTNV